MLFNKYVTVPLSLFLIIAGIYCLNKLDIFSYKVSQKNRGIDLKVVFDF